MSLHTDRDERYLYNDFSVEEDEASLYHRKQVRKMLEEKLERKRLREEFDELDGEFDWDELDK